MDNRENYKNNKKLFVKPEIEVIDIIAQSIIAESNNNDGSTTPTYENGGEINFEFPA